MIHQPKLRPSVERFPFNKNTHEGHEVGLFSGEEDSPYQMLHVWNIYLGKMAEKFMGEM